MSVSISASPKNKLDFSYEANGGRLREVYLISGLSTTNANTALSEAYAAAYAAFPIGTIHPSFSNLCIRTVNVSLDEKVKGYADCELEFTTYGSTNDDYNGYFTVSSSGEYVETQKDIYGNPLTLSYTYPSDYFVEEYIGRTVTTVATAKVYMPKIDWTITKILRGHPLAIRRLWENAINSTVWSGFDIGQVLCVSVKEELVDPRNWINKYQFDFASKLTYWNPVVYFKDPNTGSIPSDLTTSGYRSVPWYRYIDFNNTFPYFRD